MGATVTRQQAEAVLTAVRTMFAGYLGEDVTDPRDQPQLVRGYEGADWGILWESNSPYEWAIGFADGQHFDEEIYLTAQDFVPAADACRIAQHTTPTLPAGVRVEPHYSFTLCLYSD
jgi:hypothetical protein